MLCVLSTAAMSVTVQLAGAPAATPPEFGAVWYDEAQDGKRDWHSTVGVFNGATPVTAVPAPTSGYCRRVVARISVSNKDSAAIIVTVKEANSAKALAVSAIPAGLGDAFGDLEDPVGVLDLTATSLAVKLAGAPATTQPDFCVVWREGIDAHAAPGTFNGTSEVAALAAPGNPFARLRIERVLVANHDTAAITAILIQKVAAGTDREIARLRLQAGDAGEFAVTRPPMPHDINGPEHNGLTGAVLNNLAAFDASGKIKDSGYDPSDFDAAGLAAAVAGLLSTHAGLTGTSVHGLGDSSTKNVGTGAANVAAGDHGHSGVYQPADAELTALAGLSSAADKVPYFTGSGSAALADLTGAGRTFLAAATAAAETAILSEMVGDSGAGVTKGLVPAAATGVSAKFLRGDGTWQTPTAAAPKLDDCAAPDDNADLNASTSAHGLSPKATAPGAGLRSVLAIDNGETARSDKALFDATTPEECAAAGAVGSAMTAARRDHKHKVFNHSFRAHLPANFAPGAASWYTCPVHADWGFESGECYDDTNHYFVAPTDGQYMFYFKYYVYNTPYALNATGIYYIGLQVNGSLAKVFQCYAGNTVELMMQISGMFSLSATNYVTPVVLLTTDSTIYAHVQYTEFCGWRISRDS